MKKMKDEKKVTAAKSRRAARLDIGRMKREPGDSDSDVRVPVEDARTALRMLGPDVVDEAAFRKGLTEADSEPVDPYEAEDEEEECEDDSMSGLVGGAIGALVGGIGGFLLGGALGMALSGRGDADYAEGEVSDDDAEFDSGGEESDDGAESGDEGEESDSEDEACDDNPESDAEDEEA